MEALLTWLQQYGQIIAFFAQILYWAVIAVAAIWAVLLFKRLVDFKTSGPVSAAPPAPASGAKKEDVSVEEFTD